MATRKRAAFLFDVIVRLWPHYDLSETVMMISGTVHGLDSKNGQTEKQKDVTRQ